MGEEQKNLLRPIEQQINSLKELTAEQIGNLRTEVTKDIQDINKSILKFDDKLEKFGLKLEEKYVSKEYLAQVLLVQAEKYNGELQKIYERFNPIRTVLIFIATTIGGVLLVAVSKFLFGNLAT